MNLAPNPHAPAADLPADLTVYYDGACPVCRREIAAYQRQPGAERCAWVDASAGDSAGATPQTLGPDLDSARALARLHVRRADGTLVSGAAAFVLLWQAFPATRWLGRVAAVPPLPWLLEGAYRGFLRVRPLWRPTASNAPGLVTSKAFEAITPALWAELRSDHAGEAGAVQIYRGILATSRDAGVRAFAQRHGATEQAHLDLVCTWLPPSRRSRLLPAWRVAGWVTGALPGLFGPRAVYATIEAVETFVDHHYADQLRMIDALPSDPTRAALRAMLAACQGDEVAHRDEARDLGRPGAPGGFAGRAVLRLWTALVGSGSAFAVKLARRI